MIQLFDHFNVNSIKSVNMIHVTSSIKETFNIISYKQTLIISFQDHYIIYPCQGLRHKQYLNT